MKQSCRGPSAAPSGLSARQGVTKLVQKQGLVKGGNGTYQPSFFSAPGPYRSCRVRVIPLYSVHQDAGHWCFCSLSGGWLVTRFAAMVPLRPGLRTLMQRRDRNQAVEGCSSDLKITEDVLVLLIGSVLRLWPFAFLPWVSRQLQANPTTFRYWSLSPTCFVLPIV